MQRGRLPRAANSVSGMRGEMAYVSPPGCNFLGSEAQLDFLCGGALNSKHTRSASNRAVVRIKQLSIQASPLSS
jgi:hypothetical protein